MKPPPFEYRSAETVEEALAVLAEHGDEAKVLAGGQSLVPLLAFRLARPTVLLDINRVPSLDDIRVDDGTVSIGTMTRERTAERSKVVREQVPLMAAALPLIGHAAIRTRGTIGGSIAHADPAAELPAVALALDAEMVVRRPDGSERVVAAADFFLGYFTTAIQPEELLTDVRLPVAPPRTGVRFEEAVRRHGDFAMVGAAASVTLDGNTISDARIALIGMADTPVRCRAAEAVLVGSTPDRSVHEAAAAEAITGLEPPADVHASTAYRLHVARALVTRALEGAASDAGAAR